MTNSVDPDETLLPVCSGLSVRILTVNMVPQIFGYFMENAHTFREGNSAQIILSLF